MGLIDGGGLADFGSGLVSSLVTGGRALAGAFSPDVRREQAQQRARAEEAAQAQKRIVASHILEAIHSGQIDDDHLPQMQQTLGKLGYDFPVESLGASPEAKARLETHIKNKQREAILRTPEAMAMIDSGDYLRVNNLLLKNNFGDPLEFAKTAAEINKKDTTLQGFAPDQTIFQGGKLVREGTPKEQPDIASINAAIAIINDPNTSEDKRQQFRTYLDHKGQGMQIINYPSPIAVTKPDGTQGMVSFNNKGGFTETPFAPPIKEKAEKPDKALTQEQMKAAGYLNRALAANKDLLSVESSNPDVGSGMNTALGGIPGIGNYLIPDDVQLHRRARLDFLTAVLRLQSGAVINESEHKDEIAKYFPQPGDTPATLKAKQIGRQLAIEGLAIDAGSSDANKNPGYQSTEKAFSASTAGQAIDRKTEAGAAVPFPLRDNAPATAVVEPTLPPASARGGRPASTAGRLIDQQTATGAPPPVLSSEATFKSLENAKAAIAAGKDRPFIVNKLLRMGVPQSSIDRYLGK